MTAKPTPTQTNLIRYFNGDITAAKGRPAPQSTYEVCRREGWIEQTETFPFHRTTAAGAAAIGVELTTPAEPAPAAEPIAETPAEPAEGIRTWTFLGHWENGRIVVDEVLAGEHDDDRRDYGTWEEGLWAASGTGTTVEQAQRDTIAEYETAPPAAPEPAPATCTATSFSAPHAYEHSAATAAGPDWPEGYELCGQAADDDVHRNPDTGEALAPIVDANGTPVPDADPTDDALRAWMAGRVPAAECPHYIAASEARAGFKKCERCPATVADGAGDPDDDQDDDAGAPADEDQDGGPTHDSDDIPPASCRFCGCTEEEACEGEGGCAWATDEELLASDPVIDPMGGDVCTACLARAVAGEVLTVLVDERDGFKVGDVVEWRGSGHAAGRRWKIARIYVPTVNADDREPYAGLDLLNDPGPGQTSTAGRLSLLVKVDATPTAPAGEETARSTEDDVHYGAGVAFYTACGELISSVPRTTVNDRLVTCPACKTERERRVAAATALVDAVDAEADRTDDAEVLLWHLAGDRPPIPGKSLAGLDALVAAYRRGMTVFVIDPQAGDTIAAWLKGAHPCPDEAAHAAQCADVAEHDERGDCHGDVRPYRLTPGGHRLVAKFGTSPGDEVSLCDAHGTLAVDAGEVIPWRLRTPAEGLSVTPDTE